MDPHQANLQPHVLLFNVPIRFNPTPTFFGVIFDRTLSFSKHVSSPKAKFFSHLKALRCICASSCDPSKESLCLLHRAFLRLLLTYTSLGWFLFLSVTNLTKLERLHRALVASSSAISRPLLSHFSSLRRLYLPYESPRSISPCHLMSGRVVFQPPFPFYV